eukprot:13206-Heterococcus_DN1.PRE.12
MPVIPSLSLLHQYAYATCKLVVNSIAEALHFTSKHSRRTIYLDAAYPVVCLQSVPALFCCKSYLHAQLNELMHDNSCSRTEDTHVQVINRVLSTRTSCVVFTCTTGMAATKRARFHCAAANTA